MDAEHRSETSVYSSEITQRYIPEDSDLNKIFYLRNIILDIAKYL
jgi:hypothetical protein